MSQVFKVQQPQHNIQKVDDVLDELDGKPKPQDEKSKAREQLDKDAIIATMSTRNGRRFVFNILSQCGLMRNAFTGQASTTDFNLGQQNIGHWLYNLIDVECPELYLTMMKESKETNDA